MSHHIELFQQISGSGPTLVVLHGLFGDADNFRSIAQQLESHFTVVRLDLPAHGKSSTPQSLSHAAMASAVQLHLLENDIAECAVLGHSLGGKIAMAMAGNRQGVTISKLIIVDIAPRLYPPHHTDILDALDALPLAEISQRSDADKRLMSSIPDASVRRFLLKSLHKQDNNGYGWQFDLHKIRADYEEIRQPPIFEQQVEAPTLFIKGGNSNYLQLQDEPIIRSHFANPSFKEIAGTGHWPHGEKPVLFTRVCLDFLLPDDKLV